MKFLIAILLGLLVVACEPKLEEPVNLALFNNQARLIAGSTSSQNWGVLNVKDQFGTSDDASKYIEFIPSSSSKVEFTFTIPETYDLEKINQIAVVMNFKGPELATQEWHLNIKDGGVWKKIGDNSKAVADTWKEIKSFTYFRDTLLNERNFTVQFTTANNIDTSKLDSIILTVNPTFKPDPVDPTPGSWWKPTQGMKWTIQYNGTLLQKPEYQVYNIDAYDTTEATIAQLKSQGKKVICYFSGGSFEDWRPDASQFPKEVLGKGLDGWPGEKWLDVRAISKLRPIMDARIRMAAQKGCDAVDPDNMDGFTNDTGFPLTYADQLAYNKMIAEVAHANKLAVGLKNDLDQIKDLVDHFDFAVNEQCFQYNECNLLSPFISQGKPVYNIEYELSTSNFCPKAKNLLFDSMKKKYDLDSWVEPCWNTEEE